VFLILLAITVLIWLLLPPGEPSYQDRPASQWIADISRFSADDAKTRKAEDAIRQIGTNALPFVLRELKVRDDSPIMQSIERFYWRSGLRKVWLWRRTPPEIRRYQGLEALEALAPSLGVSGLTSLMTDPNRAVRDAAARSLLYVEYPRGGLKGAKAVLKALSSDRSEIREAALAGFVENGPVLQEAYPVIVKWADDPNPEIRKRVAVALAWYPLALQTEEIRVFVEPALAKLLNDPDPAVRQSVASVLRQRRVSLAPAP
jgi:hypothetical protein